MNIHNWKLFDKAGSLLNWRPDPLIRVEIASATGIDVTGFFITDPSGFIVSAEITNGGHSYLESDIVTYRYLLGDDATLTPADVSILLTDVSVFNPEPSTLTSVSGLTVNIDTSDFVYPAASYAAAVFLDPVSQGLVETEHIFILEDLLGSLIRPLDASNPFLVFRMIGDDDQIKFFSVDENQAEITWLEEVVYDTSMYVANVPLTLNIGFRSDAEGVFERIIRVYHQVGNSLYTMADILVNAEAIGEDERFRTLISNFGLPDPINIPYLFKEADINEDLPDYKIINPKSKHMILEHDKIVPFLGTYKALINAIKWLGYDDISVREWFKDVKENKRLSLLVPFDADDRLQTILKFSAEERKTLKKLNQLSLVYCITRETGEIDVWGTPITENCYAYNLKEIFIKLLALKQWLELNIIGINCRIVDITGEGVYFERIQNLVYVTDNIGYNLNVEQTLTPYGPDKNSELITGDSSIRLTFLELTNTTLNDIPYRFIDMAESAWHPSDPCTFYSLADASYLANPSDFLLIGSTFQYPFRNISDIAWKVSVEKDNAGVIGETMVTNPLFILENEIRFYNIFDTSSVFHDTSTSLTILLENAYLRNPSIDEWTNSIAYTIYPDPCNNFDYIMESSSGDFVYFNGYAAFTPDTNSRLQYAVDSNYKVPLLNFVNYKYRDSSNNELTFDRDYYLDILDGKIYMDGGVTSSSDNLTMYINWNYDTSLEEQMITVNATYQSDRMKLWQLDVSAYYWGDPSLHSGGDSSTTLLIDNSTYNIHVNHIGDYAIELFAWDSWNTLMHNRGKTPYPVWIKYPTIYTLVDDSTFMGYDASKYMSTADVSILISSNLFPIYDRYIPLQGLTVEIDGDGNPYVLVPSITYFQDIPEVGSINKFYNLTERVITIVGTDITVDEDYQEFITGDDIRLVRFDKGKYEFLEEVSSHITVASGSQPTSITLDQIPASFVLDNSTDIYILNDTYRTVANATNVGNNLVLDVSGYIFLENQVVAVIVTDNSTGYSWGSSYRVTNLDGSIHTFDNSIPEFLLDTSVYTVQAKHAFSSYSHFITGTTSATETNNVFKIYLDNSYCQELYLDNTFIYMNILFDHDIINGDWYDPSLNLVNSPYYYYSKPISVDSDTLIIFRSEYDNSTYLLNQKNIWTARYNEDNTIYFKVFNESVPIIFSDTNNFRIAVESYDSYGNLILQE